MEMYRIKSVQWIENYGFSHFWAMTIQSVLVFVLLLLLAYAVDKAATLIMRKFVPKLVGYTATKWDDIFMENHVFAKFAHFLPGVLALVFCDLIASESLRLLIQTFISTYFIIVLVLFLNAVLNALEALYILTKGTEVTIKIYTQLAKVVLFSLAGVAVISIFANKNFIDILTGLGAMVTILLIVYKDMIMDFVAGIQLSANKMVYVGDWITSPKDGADGIVIDIGLTTVKVQNWDRTITTIPTHKLTSESFTNWRGMQLSDGRRIKRHVNIDIESVHFLSDEEIERFRKIRLISQYINDKVKIISEVNANEPECFNQRRLTNIGTFRKYIENYLRESGFVNLDMMFVVRQLQATEKGIPIEIYMFSKIKEFADYEQLQSDIFDHIFAIVPTFNLRLFQEPSGHNFSKYPKTEIEKKM
ncbi:mechanosensitive ion channel family protein [Capnocytophaga sp.]|uniref:mechanosensitive ion channel family protein n=1 Tax=Capnocytophaga sp. TaxID=44737 RepID=UPI0026DCCFE1|nr:mechanosensitive ion channel domain-containing protein [Capnocytophaga sp.]MDO5104336.1 mechanosensitive ion channel [Capnocytophaga sp.]